MWTQLPGKGHTHPHPIFGPCLLWPNGWMNEDAAWYGSRPRPRPHCARRGPSSHERGTAAPLFSAHVYCGHGRPSQLLLSSYLCVPSLSACIGVHKLTLCHCSLTANTVSRCLSSVVQNIKCIRVYYCKLY